jgi:uncharacterized protein DUF3300
MSLKERFTSRCVTSLLSAACAVMMVPGVTLASTLSVGLVAGQAPAPVDQSSPIPPDQLDSLVAPIALYPDPLLAQTLAASTYPLEVLQLQQWLARNPGLKDKALADAVAQQPWDPSVQALAALPDVVKRLADDIQWTTDLGNAFLAQEADVMHSVQRMRQKAHAKGNLVSTPQQTVETQVVDSQPVIVIEQSSPDVVYVPSYNPTVVYGAPAYPYPPIYYPPYSYGWFPGAGALAFGTGVALGAAWGGGWGWGANWGDADININRNNSFNRNANITGTGNRWQHNVAHRGGAPYRDQATANRFGGTARGDSLAARQTGARQQLNRQGGNLRSSGAVGTAGAGNRTATGLSGRAGQGTLGERAGQGNLGGRAGQGNLGNRPSQLPSQGGLGGRTGQGGLGQGGNRPTQLPSQGGLSSRPSSTGDRISGRDLSRSSSGGSAFGGGSHGYNGSRARADSSRGSSSMRSGGGSRSGGFSGSRGGSRSGGFSRGGGGGGGRSRGGGRR